MINESGVGVSPPGGDGGILDLVLLKLKYVLDLFSRATNKPEGLELIERRIREIIEKWQANQKKSTILKALVDLLQVLELAMKAPDAYAHREMLSQNIGKVLEVFEDLGAVEVQARENDIFNPHIHRAIDVEPSSDVPKGRILEVYRRGFKVEGVFLGPADVVVSIGKEEKRREKDSGTIEKPVKVEQSSGKQTETCKDRDTSANHNCSSTTGAMFDISPFFPPDFRVNKIVYDRGQTVVIEVASCQISSSCPVCNVKSTREHSSYSRRPMDLPILGRTVRLQLICHKFFCDNPDCTRTVFTERFEAFIKSYARQTARLKEALTVLAFASNSKIISKAAKKLSFARSPNTFLRIIRRTPIEVNANAILIGVDDWAYRKGNNYGTIICDHASHKPIDIFPGRTAQDFKKWLIENPNIVLATRDRSESYASALETICPGAIQIADRFHLAKNLLDALKDFTRRVLPANFRVAAPKPICQSEVREETIEAPKEEGQISQRREEKRKVVARVKELRAEGKTLKEITETMKLTTNTVSRYIRLDEERASRRRSAKWHGYDEYNETLTDLVRQGKKSVEIMKILRDKGVTAGISTIFRWVSELKNSGDRDNNSSKARPQPEEKWVKHYDMTGYLWSYKEKLKEEEELVLAEVISKFPLAHSVYDIVQKFRQILKTKDHQSLVSWIEEGIHSGIAEIAKFAKGLQKNFEEVRNALIFPYSNGLVEGHVNRLKMLKRMMYGRAKIDLLRQRVLYQW